MNRKISKKQIGFAIFLALLFLSAVGVSLNVKVSIAPSVHTLTAMAQASSYQILPVTYGSTVDGKPSLFPTSTVIDTQTTVAAGTLNGTNSPVYDVTIINDRARMVNVSFSVTAVPGTSPSLTPTVQESDDGGITWYTVNAQDGTTFSAITTTGNVTGKDFPVYGDIMRVHYVSSGTGNFTFTDTAAQAK